MNILARSVGKLASSLGITTEELKKAALVPLGFLVLIIIGDIIWQALGFPGPEETLVLIKQLFTTHGYPLVFISAFVESLLLVGLYIPGSVALVLASVLSGQGVMNIWLVIAIITSAFFLGVNINYILGRFGWYHVLTRFGLKNAIEKMRLRAEKKGVRLIHFTYLNPNIASLSATSFGILHLNFSTFVLHSLIAFAYWNLMWGFLFYFLGSWVEKHLNYPTVITLILIAALIRILFVMAKKKWNVWQIERR